VIRNNQKLLQTKPNMQTKKIIKVCFQGETKRLRMADSYEALTKQSREAFAPLLD
jgi:two-component SAPR family response regulator